MADPIQIHPEFLRRLLGEGGDDAGTQIFPDALPDDLPLTLPEAAGTRVWGSTTGAATHWTFAYPGATQPPVSHSLRHWRVLLDAVGTAAEVMSSWRRAFERQGWQSGQLFQQVFVEAGRQQWMAAHPEASRTLTLGLQQAGKITQIALRVQDIDREQLGHWLGQPPSPHFGHFQRVPLPTLSAPAGWTVQPQGGNGGPERSESAVLVPGKGLIMNLDALLVDFAAQVSSQGWQEIERQVSPARARLLARTEQGYGLLGLHSLDGAVGARLVHIALHESTEGGRSFSVLLGST